MRSPRIQTTIRIGLMLVLLTAAESGAQVFFSVNPDYLTVKPEGNNVLTDFRAGYPDTSLTGFHRYFPRNFMGNTGLPSPRYFLDYGTADIGFRFFDVPSHPDRFSERDVNYYRSLGPFASLTGIAGSKELQVFKALFTHTYRRKVNVTLGFRRYTSVGFYKGQKTSTNNFYFSSNYRTAAKGFGYYLYVLSNTNKNNENGGISDTLLSDSTMLLDKGLLRRRISDASRDNRETRVMVNPYFRLTRKADSSLRAVPYLQVRSAYSGSLYRYTDRAMTSDNFYRYVYLDTVSTNDSTRVSRLTNEVAFSLVETTGRSGFHAGYRNELNRVWQLDDSVHQNHLAVAEYVLSPHADSAKTLLQLRAAAQYIVAGANQGNYRLEGNLALKGPGGRSRFFFNALHESRNADYIHNYWISNHFSWQNMGLGPQLSTHLSAGWQLPGLLKVSVLFQGVGNYLYFDHNALPSQFPGTVRNTCLQLDFSKVFLKHIGFSLQYKYQSTSHPSYVRLPGHYARPGLFYTGLLFRNNLQLQFGAEAELYESFTPYAYMPATQVFYLQDKIRTSRFPYVDVFLNARIRPVMIFLKIENVVHGFAGSGYFFVPGYYQPDRAFRFGINWLFFD